MQTFAMKTGYRTKRTSEEERHASQYFDELLSCNNDEFVFILPCFSCCSMCLLKNCSFAQQKDFHKIKVHSTTQSFFQIYKRRCRNRKFWVVWRTICRNSARFARKNY